MPSTSPISNLDSDTLLTIFDTMTCQIPGSNSWMDRPLSSIRPLTTVRAASQVCQRWRELFLASPWIWGRVIDLDITEYTGPRRIEWMDEVVRRSGQAPLWISGIIDPRKDSDVFNRLSFFARLMESWERIEQLSVVLYTDKVPDDIQIHFLSPAPILKIFDLHLPLPANDNHPLFLNTLQPDSSQRLFADHAPSFRSMKGDHVAFRLDSPWLSHIEEMFPIPREFTLQEHFSLLQHTPAIETICIGRGTPLRTWDGTLPPFPKISLPKLSSIRICNNLAVGAKILDHISPHTATSLYLDLCDFSRDLLRDRSTLSSFKKSLPFYISGYFTANPATALMISITDTGITFRDVKERNVDGKIFDIAIEKLLVSNQREADDLVECLLDTFRLSSTHDGNPSLFKSVTELKLSLRKIQRPIFPALYAMLGVFPHVKVIKTSECSCQTLFDISSSLDGTGENRESVLFPELCTVRLTSTTRDPDKIDTGLLMPFLMDRKRVGFPVGTLDLTGRTRSRSPADLRVLEAVDGLEVVWKEPRYAKPAREDCEILRYICGTGEPDRLKAVF